MGNAQSTEGPRRTSQKLSKPRTGNHAATAGLLSPGGVFSNRSRRFSTAQLPDPPAPSSTVASTPTTSSAPEVPGGFRPPTIDSVASLHSAPPSQDEPKRRSLFRSRSTRCVDSSYQGHNGGPGSRLVDRMSRASSMTYESAVGYYGHADFETPPARSDSRTSVNYNLGSYEAKRLLNLAEEPQPERAATMSDSMMPVVTEATWTSVGPASHHNAPITRTNSDVSLCMPVRRRSMIQTPGVATRSGSSRDLPPLPRMNVRHSLPATPSLSRQHSMESYRSGIVPTPSWAADSDSAPRVATPCEDEYLSIGAFKLGTLRITNGFPSPATPDAEGTCGNDGFNAGRGVAREGYFARAQNSKTDNTAGAAIPRVTSSPGFLPEISQGPPLSSVQGQPARLALRTMSEVTVFDDKLFDGAQPEYSSVEILDVRRDPNAMPPHAERERDADSSVARTDSGCVSTGSRSSEVCCKSLAKADSGYSSNVSLRSFHAKARGHGDRPNAPSLETQFSRPPSQGDEERVSPASHSSPKGLGVRQSIAPEAGHSPPPVPTQDATGDAFVCQARLRNVIVKELPDRSPTRANRLNTPNAASHMSTPAVTLSSGSERLSSPTPEPRSRGSGSSSVSGTQSSPRSIGGKTPKTGRLQRLLGGSRRATLTRPVSPALHVFGQDSVPPVPKEAEQKLHGRPSHVPSMPKRPPPRSHPSLDTLKTIFSVGSLEASLDAVNTMQATPAAADLENEGGAWKQGLQSVPASIANVAARVVAKRARARKSPPVSREKTAEGSPALENRNGDGMRDDTAALDADVPIARQEPSKRTTSLTLQDGQDGQAITPTHRTFDASPARSSPGCPSQALPGRPVAKSITTEPYAKAPGPTPPSRRPQALRVPPSLSRTTSRESVQSYPSAHPLTRKPSMNSMRSNCSSQASTGYGSARPVPHNLTSMDPRRLQSFRQYSPEVSPYISPTWEVRSEVGRRTPQPLTGSDSRRNSISSVQSEGAYLSTNARGRRVQAPHQPLRHRTSFDGHGYRQRYSRHAHPPAMSNGYTPPVKPAHNFCGRGQPGAAAVGSRSQSNATAGLWYQGQSLPYIPRGHHHRNRSNGQRRPDAPYRVLHSYNSPAYRHAPIWS